MNVALIAAGGGGARLGHHEPKPFVPLAGRPLLAHSLARFAVAPAVDAVVLVVEEPWLDRARRLVADRGLAGVTAIVAGGQTRAASVARGLAALPAATTTVLVHDAARPLLSAGLLERLLAAAGDGQPVIPVLPVADTLKEIAGDRVRRTLDRRCVRRVQTPQVFPRALLAALYRRYADRLASVTDDASLAELAGVEVRVVAGERCNIKITWPEDLVIAEALLHLRPGCAGAARPG